IPVFRGHLLNREDKIIRKHILNLMCNLETSWNTNEEIEVDFNEILQNLKELESDGIVKFEKNRIQVTESGKPFVRNVCMAFDKHLQQKQPETRLFSMTV